LSYRAAIGSIRKFSFVSAPSFLILLQFSRYKSAELASANGSAASNPLLKNCSKRFESGPRRWRRGQPNCFPIGSFAVFSLFRPDLFIVQHPFQCRMARRKRVTKIIEIKLQLFQSVANFDCSHCPREDASQGRPNRICETRRRIIHHVKQPADCLPRVGRERSAAGKNPNCFSKARNFGIENVACLDATFQFAHCLFQRFVVFVGGHRLWLRA